MRTIYHPSTNLYLFSSPHSSPKLCWLQQITISVVKQHPPLPRVHLAELLNCRMQVQMHVCVFCTRPLPTVSHRFLTPLKPQATKPLLTPCLGFLSYHLTTMFHFSWGAAETYTLHCIATIRKTCFFSCRALKLASYQKDSKDAKRHLTQNILFLVHTACCYSLPKYGTQYIYFSFFFSLRETEESKESFDSSRRTLARLLRNVRMKRK